MADTAISSTALTNSSGDRLAINADWLMKLRWVAVVGQLLTILVVYFGIGIEVRLSPLLVALVITSLSNLGFTLWLRAGRDEPKFPENPASWNRVFATLMALDLVVLTSLLYFTGGHTNPFLLFYFVNLALSGILLPAKWAWLLNFLTIFCFAALFRFQIPLEDLREPESLLSVAETGSATLAQIGLLVAFGACTTVIVYFATRLTAELEHRDLALRRSEIRQARSERWEALGTLAAGAAHELATPLTTIAVIAREIELALPSHDASEDLIKDVQAINQELQRCRGILNQMSIDAGHVTAEQPKPAQVGALMREVLEGLHRDSHRINMSIEEAVENNTVVVPRQSTCMAIRGMVHNALDASADEAVDFTASADTTDLEIVVRDRGTGMSPEVLLHADEPFFSTKEVGSGMGLGRFLARTVFERFGGSIATESTPDKGTTVTMRIPLEQKS